MVNEIRPDIVKTTGFSSKHTDLQQQTSPFKNYIQKEVPMLENLLEYYRKSDGATKKKILMTIFAKKLIVVKGKVIEPSFTEPVQLTFKISKSIGNSKEKKVPDIDITLLRS